MLAGLTSALAGPFGSVATRDFSMFVIVWPLALVILLMAVRPQGLLGNRRELLLER